MEVIAHRSPLKRIDFRLKPRPPEPVEPEGVRASRELFERLTNERIWRCVERASQGQGSATE